MILKMMGTSNGNVLIDNIEQITRVGVTGDMGDTIKIFSGVDKGFVKKRSEVLHDILSLYNLIEHPDLMHVFNLVLRSNVDNRKEFRTVLFKGPGFLMNDTGHTMETYKVTE